MDMKTEEITVRATIAVLNLLMKVRREGFSRSLFDNILPPGWRILINNGLQYCRTS